MGQVSGTRCLINYVWHTLWVGGSAHTGVELGPRSTQGRTTRWLEEKKGRGENDQLLSTPED